MQHRKHLMTSGKLCQERVSSAQPSEACRQDLQNQKQRAWYFGAPSFHLTLWGRSTYCLCYRLLHQWTMLTTENGVGVQDLQRKASACHYAGTLSDYELCDFELSNQLPKYI